jgi:hypothetical protein
MSTIHTEQAKRHSRRQLDNDGNGIWVEVPVVATAGRIARFPDPGPKIPPNLEKLLVDLGAQILKTVLKHRKRLTQVPAYNAEKFREATDNIARHAALEQELDELETKTETSISTRAVSRRYDQALEEQASIDITEANEFRAWHIVSLNSLCSKPVQRYATLPC